MRILSWNVNGLRACARKGFLDFLDRCNADVVALQEVRALPEQLDDELRNPPGWNSYFHPAESKKGYSGVAIYSRMPATKITTQLPQRKFNVEGRFLMAQFGRLSVASIYFPKGGDRSGNNERVPYKLGFYRSVFRALEEKRKVGPVYAVGDYNTAHTEIDLTHPKNNAKTSGFLPEERREISRWLSKGWVDVFRRDHPDEPGHHTWWRQWGGARERNVGWRIDYVLATPTAAKRATQAFIWADVLGSDHCPVGVDIRD